MANLFIRTGDIVQFTTDRRPGQILSGSAQVAGLRGNNSVHTIEEGKLMIYNWADITIEEKITEAEYLGKEAFAKVTKL